MPQTTSVYHHQQPLPYSPWSGLMPLNVNDSTVPLHPSEIDFNLNLQMAIAAIQEARSIHRQLSEELKESKRDAVPATRAIASADQVPKPSEPVAVEVPAEADRAPQRIIRRVEIR